jgi:hypothetical protein
MHVASLNASLKAGQSPNNSSGVSACDKGFYQMKFRGLLDDLVRERGGETIIWTNQNRKSKAAVVVSHTHI